MLTFKLSSINHGLKETASEENGAVGITSTDSFLNERMCF
jgi:hypothetical protein